MDSFILNKVQVSEDGRKVDYDYSISPSLNKYFQKDNPYYVLYDKDISKTPKSLLIIPLLANIMPMSWFIGFDVFVEDCDHTFLKSLNLLKKQFQSFFPKKSLKGKFIYKNLVSNRINGKNSSLLFSGGLDSFDSLIRNLNKDPYLISIHGADVPITDKETWSKFQKFNSEEILLNKNKLFYVETNLREFYTYRLDLLTELGWWGGIQHGMALLGVLAPLTYIFGITDIRIAASATHEVSYSWGSSPLIDENVKWANTNVTHDGYDQRRTDKVDNIVRFTEKTGIPLKLRVCYSDDRKGYNCNRCHKCQRTILSLILSNADPEDFGFEIPDNFYEILFKNFNENTIMTAGIKYQWTCLQEKAKENSPFHVITDEILEKKAILKFANLDLDTIVNKNEKKVKTRKRIKLILRNRLGSLYSIYKRIK